MAKRAASASSGHSSGSAGKVRRRGCGSWFADQCLHASIAFAAAQHAGVVDEQVEWFTVGKQREFKGKRGMASGFGHIQGRYVHAPGKLAGQLIQRRRLARLPAGGHQAITASPVAGQAPGRGPRLPVTRQRCAS